MQNENNILYNKLLLKKENRLYNNSLFRPKINMLKNINNISNDTLNEESLNENLTKLTNNNEGKNDKIWYFNIIIGFK